MSRKSGTIKPSWLFHMTKKMNVFDNTRRTENVRLVKLASLIRQTGRKSYFFLYRKRLQEYHCCIVFSNSKQNKEYIWLLLLFGAHVFPWSSLKHTYIVLGEQREHQNKACHAAYCIKLHQSLYLFVSPVCLLLQPFLTLLLQIFTKLTHRSLALSQLHCDALLEQALLLSNTLPVFFLYLGSPLATSSIEVFFAFCMEQAEKGSKTTNV